MGHSLLDWSFYALILVFPVILLILYLNFGSYVQSWLKSLVSAVGGCSIGVGQSPSAARRERESRIVNVGPGLRPGFLSFDVEHWRLHWYYAVGADQATNLHGVSCIRASTMEVEEEIGGIGFGHVITGPILNRQFLCGRS